MKARPSHDGHTVLVLLMSDEIDLDVCQRSV